MASDKSEYRGVHIEPHMAPSGSGNNPEGGKRIPSHKIREWGRVCTK